METVRVSEKTGSDGVLRLQICVGQAEAEYEAVVVLQRTEDAHRTTKSTETRWPQGYFERTFGSITDETFERPPQGEFRKPVDFE
jgi:hypothetical protein